MGCSSVLAGIVSEQAVWAAATFIPTQLVVLSLPTHNVSDSYMEVVRDASLLLEKVSLMVMV